jgi:hypothetical protein
MYHKVDDWCVFLGTTADRIEKKERKKVDDWCVFLVPRVARVPKDRLRSVADD